VKLWFEIYETTSDAANLAPMLYNSRTSKKFELQVKVWKCVDIEQIDCDGAS